MTSVQATHSGSNGVGFPEETASGESAPSRFTAVNGRGFSSTGQAVNGTTDARSPSETPSDQIQVVQAQAAARNHHRPEDKLAVATQREEMPRPSTNGERLQNRALGNQYPQALNSHGDNTITSPNKRKRSDSQDKLHVQPISTTYHTHTLPQSKKESPTMQTYRGQPDIDSGISPGDGHEGQLDPRKGHHDSTSPRQEQNAQRQYPHPEEGRENTIVVAPWYGQNGSRQPYEQAHTVTPTHSIHSDAQLAEALTRESQHLDDQSGRTGGSPDDGDSQETPQRSLDYGTDRTPQSSLPVDHKRRKRVFSNRTKTGCLTCRRRKKKCDEQKPEYGFGEPQTPVSYPQPTVYTGHPQPNQRLEPSPVAFRRAGSTSGQGGVSGRPILIDDERDAQMTTSPQHAAPPADKPGTTAAPAFMPGHLPKTDYNRVPPLHELPRPGEPSSATSVTTARPVVQTPQTASPRTPHQAQAQAQAQLALQHQALRRPKTEKEKMLAGELYYAYVPELVDERERCKAACWRFNNSTNPNLGVSRDERSRLFRAILQPKEIPSTLNIATPTSPVGSVGENVVVEAPFTCDYGYNISLGNDVCIGANCTIMDTCSVSIGARCILGPSVSIYSATLPIDPRRRKGSQGPSLGRGIIIEDDCWIGGGVTILPGLKIGRSSTIGAGAVVTRDVPRFVVVAGNPARNNPIHTTIFPSPDPQSTQTTTSPGTQSLTTQATPTPLTYSLLLSSTLDILTSRIALKTADQDLGLLQAVDERLAVYGYVTNTAVKFLVVVDVGGGAGVGVREGEVKGNPFYIPDERMKPGAGGIVSRRFGAEVTRIGKEWRGGVGG
ncbi:hypothetical protein FGG08_001203 [Glutinoglossum americanum]|uniref:Maltose/galactoside acetyltransferase domain-containing protein n=1 Tax=Glutinoglossum americanum TaxID=1670608 RepID=A0A9P8IC09_9PEZI|nr:hypothetical protein FGG08_001203 [Glutinoglossum americanum]